MPVRKNRDGISDETKAKVVSIYEDDEYSRILPGTKDKVSIGREIYQQKRLLLCNVKELYSEFQQKFPNSKIGLSRFFELKPKWCVAPGASGTHRVCVCSIHQNAMLLADACEISYRQMMAAVVCGQWCTECQHVAIAKQCLCFAVDSTTSLVLPIV